MRACILRLSSEPSRMFWRLEAELDGWCHIWLRVNKPFPSCFELHYENEAKYKVFVMKISFHSYANKTYFHMKSFALSLAFVVRFKVTRKWPIVNDGRRKCISPAVFFFAYWPWTNVCDSHGSFCRPSKYETHCYQVQKFINFCTLFQWTLLIYSD